MEKKSLIETALERVAQIKGETAKAKAAACKQLEKNRSLLAELESELKKAALSGDQTAYNQARAQKQDAQNAAEMLELQLNLLNEQALIDEQEYKALVSGITNELKAADQAAMRELIALADKMFSIGDEVYTKLAPARKALSQLAALRKLPSYNDVCIDCLHLSEVACNDAAYKSVTGKDPVADRHNRDRGHSTAAIL